MRAAPCFTGTGHALSQIMRNTLCWMLNAEPLSLGCVPLRSSFMLHMIVLCCAGNVGRPFAKLHPLARQPSSADLAPLHHKSGTEDKGLEHIALPHTRCQQCCEWMVCCCSLL